MSRRRESETIRRNGRRNRICTRCMCFRFVDGDNFYCWAFRKRSMSNISRAMPLVAVEWKIWASSGVRRHIIKSRAKTTNWTAPLTDLATTTIPLGFVSLSIAFGTVISLRRITTTRLDNVCRICSTLQHRPREHLSGFYHIGTLWNESGHVNGIGLFKNNSLVTRWRVAPRDSPRLEKRSTHPRGGLDRWRAPRVLWFDDSYHKWFSLALCNHAVRAPRVVSVFSHFLFLVS